MRILMVHCRYQIRGGEDSEVAAEVAVLRAAGLEVHLWSPSNDDINRWQAAARCFWSGAVADQMRAQISVLDPDIIHFHNTAWALGPTAYEIAGEAGVPVVAALHNYRLICPAATLWRDGEVCHECVGKAVPWPAVRHGCFRDSRLATAPVALGSGMHRLLGTHDAVDLWLAVSAHVRTWMILGGMDETRIIVKPNCAWPDPGAHEGPDQGYFVYAGALNERKGITTLIEAWRLLGEHAPQLFIIGDGPMRDLGWQNDKIRHIGPLDHGDVLKLMRAARAVIIPSVWHDPAPVVSIEAAACGTPVIASDAGGLPGLQSSRAWVFPKRNAAELAAKVAAFGHMGQAELQSLRILQRRHYEENYSGEAQLRQLMGVHKLAGDIRAKRVAPAAPPAPAPSEGG